MALQFQPRPGAVVVCDFRGYELPEMVKVRPVVVLARNRQNRQLVTVVPLSTTAPMPLLDVHYALPQNPLPGKAGVACWAKCDMLATVCLGRLDRWKMAKRQYVTPQLDAADLAAIQKAAARAMGLAHLLIL